MEISVAQGGKFTFTIKAKELSKGLRSSKLNPRDKDFLVTCIGAVGKDEVLQVTDALIRMATATITDGFPFPQIFVFTNMVIVCGLQKIYEWDGTSLNLKYTAAAAGGTWSAVDFYDYVYMSNGKIAVIRDAGDGTYSLQGGTTPTKWLVNHAYILGDRITCSDAYSVIARRSFVYVCVKAGTSHATTEPVWPLSGTIVDGTAIWTTTIAQPTATAICNYNGQVIIGAPDVIGLGANLVLPALPITVVVSQSGTMVTT